MTRPPSDAPARARTQWAALPLPPVFGYAQQRIWMEARRPGLWVGAVVAVLVAWAGTHLEVLRLDDRPDRAWGLVLSTVETVALLVVLAARLRGADLSAVGGTADPLQASFLGAAGLSTAETLAAAASAWLLAVGATVPFFVVSKDISLPILGVASWAISLIVELALVAAWLALAATWLGRLPGLGLALAAIGLGRAGMGGFIASLWPPPAVAPPDVPAFGRLGAGVAIVVALVALATASRGATRSID